MAKSVAVLGTGIMGLPMARNLASAVHALFAKAIEQGHGDQDMAAVYRAAAQ